MTARAAFLADIVIGFTATLLQRAAERPFLHLAFLVALLAVSMGAGEVANHRGWYATAWFVVSAIAFGAMLALNGGRP